MPLNRKYPYIKLDTGDYLLASNDRQTILRFIRYHEDGSAEYGDGSPIRGPHWMVKRRPASDWPERGFVFTEQMETWLAEGWETYYTLCRTRAEAEHNVADLIGGRT